MKYALKCMWSGHFNFVQAVLRDTYHAIKSEVLDTPNDLVPETQEVRRSIATATVERSVYHSELVTSVVEVFR